MNAEKHKKDLLRAWLSGEDIPVPTRSRNQHLMSTFVKIDRPLAGRSPKRATTSSSASQIDPLAMRLPGRSWSWQDTTVNVRLGTTCRSSSIWAEYEPRLNTCPFSLFPRPGDFFR
jgi:hypothetical protein